MLPELAHNFQVPTRAPFLVLGLPRSRTAWTSRFLTYGGWSCGHDEIRHMRQLEDVQSWLSQPYTGSVETAAAPFWRLARHLRPDLRLAVIRRDPDEAARSAVAAGFGDDLPALTAMFHRLDHKLGQIERRAPGVRSFRYEELVYEDVCAELFEHCLPYRFDREWWKAWANINVQVSAQAVKRYVAAHQTQIVRLHGIARQKSLALLAARRAPDPAGLTLAFEPFRDFLHDAAPLIREHLAAVGEHPDGLGGKNLAKFQDMADAGELQVTVARCNGKVFGYLLTTLGESLEAPGRTWACHTAFYGSPDLPGLGLKLQRKALDGLRGRGVHEVVGRAGVRGSGDRQSVLYDRLGFEPFGTYYRLQLEETA